MEDITRGMMVTEIGTSTGGRMGSGGQWDFEAPMYVDFATIAKPGTIDIDYEIDDSSYFSIDHECHRGVSLESGLSSCIKSTLFYGSDGAQSAASSSGQSSVSDQHSPSRTYSTFHSSPNLKFGRCMDVIADVPQNRMFPTKQPDIILSPSKDLDCSYDDDETNPGAVTGTWVTAPLGKPPAAHRSPAHERGRQRFVAVVTSAKKRLSMSVDRGHKKLTEMKKSLAEPISDNIPTKDNKIIVQGGKQTRFGSIEDITDGPVGHARRRILSGIDNLPKIDDSMENESPRVKKSFAMRRSVATGRAEDIVQSLTRLNEVAVSENMHQSKIPVPHSGIPFSEMATRLTIVKPFSFWTRDSQLVEKRERKRLQVIAEEKKAREFHAQPFPDIIYRPAKGSSASHNLNHSISGKTSASSGGQSAMSSFKARLPTVLSKKPFIPQKSSKPPTEILKKFEDSYASRAEKIKAMEAARKERVAKEEEERAEREKQRREAEQSEMRRLRLQTVHRAQPMPSYLRTGTGRQSSATGPARTAVGNSAAADITISAAGSAAAIPPSQK